MYSNEPAHSAADLSARAPQARRAGWWSAEPRWAVLAPVAVAHVWTMTWLAWTIEPAGQRNPRLAELGLGASLGWACLAAVGVVVGGATLAAVPRRMRRDDRETGTPAEARRSAGCLRGCFVTLVVGVGGTTLGLVAAGTLGPASGLLAAATAAGMVFYPLAGRFFPAVAVVGTGLWHALVMAVPNPLLGFAWPVVLNLTHVIGVSAITRVHGFDRPRLTARGGWGVCLGWVFLSLLLVGGMTARGTGAVPGVGGDVGRWIWLPPAVVAAVFVAALGVALRGGDGRREAARRLGRIGTRWLILYDAAWLIGAGLWWPAATVVALAAVSIVLPWAGRRLTSGRPAASPGYQLP
ncbi:MAG: hypothetical protein ACODAQ_00620 [Phycisphaeraceae bacterium]